MLYPKDISKRLASLLHNRSVRDGNAFGTTANFGCGSAIRFSLSIDTQSSVVTAVNFSSNGCGFMFAAADVIAESLIKKRLVDLRGLSDADLNRYVAKSLGEIPTERRECVTACIQALHLAFADFRTTKVEEFLGEKALICTCFGVSEETIENLIKNKSLTSVEEVTMKCNAGAGCGSCRMLIQEMLDKRFDNI